MADIDLCYYAAPLARLRLAYRGRLTDVLPAKGMTWENWLPRAYEQWSSHAGVDHYVHANCHCLIWHGQVYQAFGYHWRTLMADLTGQDISNFLFVGPQPEFPWEWEEQRRALRHQP